ncbi:dTMP kinase [Synechocystis sp. PCC 7509]|uniref:dTMP kinase n=1 Tax=Synechocystis sp. PCC 7509 TaxID=927677 RepID=UPI0002ACECD7|nr:dTMP kinase [Synechocystis sp. PCC 7509]
MVGKLIVFEGVEGCGKTTQLQKTYLWLQDKFSNQKILTTREPGDTELGLGLRQLLLSLKNQQPIYPAAELLLYAADRAQHVQEVLLPGLATDTIILCDRYTDSTIAYQGYGRDLPRAIIDQLNLFATNGLESDLTIWLDIDVELSLPRTRLRGTSDRIEQADLAFHKRVQHGYNQLAQAFPHRIKRVDASLDEQAVQGQIRAILQQHII